MVAYNHAKRLAALGHEVVVVTSKVEPRERSGIFDGVRLLRIRAFNYSESLGAPFPIFSPNIVRVLRREVQRADIVHVHDSSYMSSFIAAVYARWYKKPLVLMQHVDVVKHPNWCVMLFQELIYRTTGRYVLHASDRIITLNSRVEAFVLSKGVHPAKVAEFRNGVDFEQFHPVSAEQKAALKRAFGLSPDKKIILFVGRFVPKKGFNELLRAGSDEYQLVLCGGEVPPSTDLNLVFLGKLSQKEVVEAYQAADVFVLPSTNEGFPLTVQEAMATGLPIIMTYDEGYRRYELDENAIYFLHTLTHDSIQDAIQAVIADPARMEAMSAYSKAYAAAHFNWTTIIEQLLGVYRAALAQQRRVCVSTSWDDGHVLDLRLAQLLGQYGIRGTFYIAPHDFESAQDERLTTQQMRALAQDFEIGAHTMTHRSLTDLPDDAARAEIVDSKNYLERVTGKAVTTFCYPRGAYAPKHVRMVQDAGFVYARSVRRHSFASGSALEAKTTLHCYDHYLDAWQILKFARFNPVRFVRYYRHWDRLAKDMFDDVLARGGVYHLWGHSWEIEKFGDWERLEGVLSYISGRPGVRYVTNQELI